jgi:hypothetical protein
MTVRSRKTFTCVIVVLLLLSTTGAVFGFNQYPISFQWDFQNYCYLDFNQAMNFTTAPIRGVFNNSRLVGCWNMNEGSGVVAHDSSGNGNNGTLVNSPTWVAGKHGNGLSFNGNGDYVSIPNSNYFNSTDELTIAFWARFISGNLPAVEKSSSYLLYWDGASHVYGAAYPNSAFGASGFPADNNWHQIVYTYAPNSQQVLYVDGVSVKSGATGNVTISVSSNGLKLGYVYGSSRTGTVDDVYIYNSVLTASEVAALYTQPDSDSLSNYYNYQDPVNNNTMLIHVDNPNGNSNNIASVTCTNFFTENKLVFQANNSVTLNVWTNLGKPIFTTGVWNNQNYTATLTLDASSTAELKWNSGTPPSTSSLSTSSTTANKTAIFSILWSDSQSLSGGGYFFSTNNTGQWVNASWVPFSSSPFWGNVSLSLNNNVGANVGFREFANNSLNLWGDSGIYAITTTNDMTLATPTQKPSSVPTASPTLMTSTPTSTPTANPTAIPMLPPKTNQLASQIEAIVVATIVVLVAVLARAAFNKGYIKIEIVDEEGGEIVDGENEDGDEKG